MLNLENILNEKIINNFSVGGGCIADSRKIKTESGKEYFIKSYSGSGNQILQNEANGLKELSKSGAIRIPKVVYFDIEFLVLEFIKTGNRKTDFSESFGRQFAEMHKTTSELFGFFEDNFIGATLQKNLPRKENWTEFYLENRLVFQFKLAEKKGYVDSRFRDLFNRFEKVVPKLLKGSEEPPSLLHGDLWGGNFMVDEFGEPVLIDPAVYYGHREADLGMTRLFGGFDSKFYSSYNEANPLPDGWEERVDLYKFYHIINHLNLFGTGYLSQTISTLKNYLR